MHALGCFFLELNQIDVDFAKAHFSFFASSLVWVVGLVGYSLSLFSIHYCSRIFPVDLKARDHVATEGKEPSIHYFVLEFVCIF